jgi:hypothetical protein
MKTRNAITKLIIITMAAAVLAAAGLLCGDGWVQPVEAQSGDGSVRFVSYASFGIVPGERVRLSMANTAESAGTLSLSFQYYLAHGSNASSSVPLYESELIQVPPGEFRFSDVSREDLKTEGESETRRAQVLVRVTIIAPAGSNPDNFPVLLEVIEDEGPSTQHEYLLVAKNSPPKSNTVIGLIHGQSLRYSFFNPNEEGSQPVRVQAYIYDSYGNLMTQTDPVELRPGQFQTVDVNRDDLRVAGEKDTGRLQVRAGIQVMLMDGSVRSVNLPISIEIVNNRTGSTNTGTYFTGSVTVSDDGFGL